MYKIYANDLPLHDLRDDDLAVLNPKLTLELNKTGSLTFNIMENHPNSTEIKRLVTNIKTYKSDKTSNEHGYQDELLFWGRPLTDSKDFYNVGEIYCEGELAYLNDSIQRPFELHDMTIRAFLELMIANHNSDVEVSKRFTIGTVNVVDDSGDGLLYRKNEEYVNTLNIIIDRLINRLGGYLKVRHEDDVMYLDYVQSYGINSTQVIQFGENILDLSQFTSAENIVTRIIPLGAKDETTGERLTIKSLNENIDFIEDVTAASLFGQITSPIVFEDITTVGALYYKGLKYLQNCINLALTIELSAIDLNIVDVSFDRIKLGDMVRVVSTPHHLDAYFLVTKLEIDMANPSNNKIVLGKTVETLTTQQSNIEAKSTNNSGGTIVTDSTINGNILINGAETNVYTHPTESVKHTDLGGLAIKIINKTGANTVKGSVVSANSTLDNSFKLQASEYDSIGIVLESGVADGQETWIVISGVAEVLLEDNTLATHGNWVTCAVTDGRANASATAPSGGTIANIDNHFKEIGHCLESKVAGTNVLAKCIIHFN